jgi:hypothetical protein
MPAREKHHGKPTSDATIKKELVTFRQIWNWAKNDGRVQASCPLLDENGRWKIRLEKSAEREKFRTWEEIGHRGRARQRADPRWRSRWRRDSFLVNHVFTKVLQQRCTAPGLHSLALRQLLSPESGRKSHRLLFITIYIGKALLQHPRIGVVDGAAQKKGAVPRTL